MTSSSVCAATRSKRSGLSRREAGGANRSVRHPSRSAPLPRLEQEQQRNRREKDDSTQNVDSRKREHACLCLHLPVEHEQRLLLREHRIRALRNQSVRYG